MRWSASCPSSASRRPNSKASKTVSRRASRRLKGKELRTQGGLRMLRLVFVVATAAVLLGAGALSAAAGNRHAGQAAALSGQALTGLTSGAMLEIKATDDEEAAQAAALEAGQAAA